jgi:hypothetical protein
VLHPPPAARPVLHPRRPAFLPAPPVRYPTGHAVPAPYTGSSAVMPGSATRGSVRPWLPAVQLAGRSALPSAPAAPPFQHCCRCFGRTLCHLAAPGAAAGPGCLRAHRMQAARVARWALTPCDQCCQYFALAYGHLVAAARIFPESGGPEVLGGVRGRSPREKHWGFSAILGGFHAKFNNAVLPRLL